MTTGRINQIAVVECFEQPEPFDPKEGGKGSVANNKPLL